MPVEEISSLMQGFAIALTPYNLMLMLIGILLGVIIGVLPGPRRCQRRRDPAAADVYHAADLGDHHAFVHLLGSVVRRRNYLDSVQYSGRAVVGRHYVRWSSDGPARPRRRSIDRCLYLFVRRRARCRDPDHVPGPVGCQVRLEIWPGGVLRCLLPDVRQFYRHGQRFAVQGDCVDVPGVRARIRRPRQDDRHAAHDVRSR